MDAVLDLHGRAFVVFLLSRKLCGNFEEVRRIEIGLCAADTYLEWQRVSYSDTREVFGLAPPQRNSFNLD
jgi:hypothetical protein